MRTDSFVSIAARLRTAATAFDNVAELADVATVASPKAMATRPIDGVSRPVEDVVMAREANGVYRALDATRRHAVQAVLHVEAATRHAKGVAATLDGERAR